MEITVGLVFLGRKRPGFDQEYGSGMEDRVRRALGSAGYKVFEPPTKAVDDPTLREALSACAVARVDAMVTLQTTMADGRFAPTVSQLWRDPVVLWATPEKQSGDMVSSCSLVGVHNWASILNRLDHPCEIVYGAPESPDATAQLSRAIRVVAAAKRLRTPCFRSTNDCTSLWWAPRAGKALYPLSGRVRFVEGPRTS